jgi:hypothetical protein
VTDQPAAGRDCEPVFIVGSDRSGSTLLRLLLDASPSLSIPSESWFLLPLLDRFPAPQMLDADELTTAAEILETHRRWRDWHISPARLARLVEEQVRLTPTDLAGFVDAVFRTETGVEGDVRWGDKTPDYVRIIPAIHRLFPRAHFVGIVRDGRDVYLSLQERGWRGRSVSRIMRHWKTAVNSWDRATDVVPTSQMTSVRYEDLVSDPEDVLEQLCDRVHLEFDPAMLNFHERAATRITDAERADGLHAKVQAPISTAELQRWRHDLPLSRRWMVEGAAWDELTACGYEPTIGRRRGALMAQTVRATHGIAKRVPRRRDRPTGAAPQNS